MQGEIWLSEQFARIADVPELSVKVRIKSPDESREVKVTLPNLQQPELQQLGACIDQNCNLFLMLRNDSQAPTKSAPVPVLG